jgi:hypothetical protein
MIPEAPPAAGTRRRPCTCPKRDNQDLAGTPYSWVDAGCPRHGDQAGRPISTADIEQAMRDQEQAFPGMMEAMGGTPNTKIPLGPDACESCAVRQGLGNCSTCNLRMHRGIDEIEAWVALAIWYIGEVPITSEAETRHLEVARALLWWAKGHDEDLRFRQKG